MHEVIRERQTPEGTDRVRKLPQERPIFSQLWVAHEVMLLGVVISVMAGHHRSRAVEKRLAEERKAAVLAAKQAAQQAEAEKKAKEAQEEKLRKEAFEWIAEQKRLAKEADDLNKKKK